MMYEVRLENNGGIIFKRFFNNDLELEYEKEPDIIMSELADAIQKQLIADTIKKFGTFILKKDKKIGSYDLTLRSKNGIFVEKEIDYTSFPISIRHNVNVKHLLPEFITRLHSI